MSRLSNTAPNEMTRSRHELEDAAAVAESQRVQLAACVFGERAHRPTHSSDLSLLRHLAAVVAQGPYLAAAVVPVDIGAAQGRNRLAAVDEATDHGAVAVSGGIVDDWRLEAALVTGALAAVGALHDVP